MKKEQRNNGRKEMFERVQERVIGREMGKISLPDSSVRVHKTVGHVPLMRPEKSPSQLSFYDVNVLPIFTGIIDIIPIILLKEIVHPKINVLSSPSYCPKPTFLYP